MYFNITSLIIITLTCSFWNGQSHTRMNTMDDWWLLAYQVRLNFCYTQCILNYLVGTSKPIERPIPFFFLPLAELFFFIRTFIDPCFVPNILLNNIARILTMLLLTNHPHNCHTMVQSAMFTNLRVASLFQHLLLVCTSTSNSLECCCVRLRTIYKTFHAVSNKIDSTQIHKIFHIKARCLWLRRIKQNCRI